MSEFSLLFRRFGDALPSVNKSKFQSTGFAAAQKKRPSQKGRAQ